MHVRFWRYWSRSSKVQPMEPTETGKSSSETCMFFCWGAFFGCCPAAFSSEFLGRTLVDLLGLALDPAFPNLQGDGKKAGENKQLQ